MCRMIVLLILLAAYVLAGLAYWLWTAYAVFRMDRGVPHLDRLDVPAPPRWPALSVVVAACNEGDKIEAAARTLPASDYPDLQVVLVDDRSTDETGAIIDRLAAEDPRVRAVHVAELPDGWLGKVHALQRGLDECGGEFILFTDADVHFEGEALRKAVAYCQARGLHYLTALPMLWRTNLLLDALIGSFIRQLMAVARPWQLRDPNAGGFLGVGAFNLVRRSALEATEGLQWLRLEVADDAGLALMMKQSGACCELVNAFGLVGLHWYRTLGEAARGSERIFATPSNFSLARMLAMVPLMLALELAPILTPLALFCAPLRAVGFGGLAVLAVFLATAVLMSRWGRQPIGPLLLGPLLAPFSAVIAIRAGLLAWRRGGIVWRGTLYRTEALRAGQRVHLP
jgi:hypothetical protein